MGFSPGGIVMKLKSVRIENFRAIRELDLELHPQLTVLHGANAHGKTSVLRAIAVGLGAIPWRLPDVQSVNFARSDPRRGGGPTLVTLSPVEGEPWSRYRGTGKANLFAAPRASTRWLNQHLDRIVEADRNGDALDLPIVASYDTERAMLDVPLRRRNFPRDFPRYAALKGALLARTNFRRLFQWFYFKENEELRDQRDRRDFDFRRRDLSAVREAISGMLGDLSEPRIQTRPLRFELDYRWNGETRPINLLELSGGYQAVLALSADLAWRMAQGNPHRENPLSSSAIVLIDEVDLHLHPRWQQRILTDLLTTFPNAQFIVSTHSPQVLTTVRPQQIVHLARDGANVVSEQPVVPTYGAEAGAVLQAAMGVDERPPHNEFTRLLSRYTDLVADGEGETEPALRLRRRLDKLSGRDPALYRANMEMRKQQVLREIAASR